MRTIATQCLLILHNRLQKIQAIGLCLLLPVLIVSLFTALDKRPHQYAEDLATYSKSTKELTEWMKATYDSSLQEKHSREFLFNDMVIQKAVDFEKGEYRKYAQGVVDSWTLFFSLQENRGYNIDESFFPTLDYGASMAHDDLKRAMINNHFARQRLVRFEELLASSKEMSLNDVVGITASAVVYRWLGHAGSEVYYLPCLFMISLLFASPIFLDDKRHSSLLEIKPISHFRYLLEKIASYWLVITGFEVFLLAIIMLSISLKYGTGNWSLNILTFVGQEERLMSSVIFYGEAVLFFLLINLFLVTFTACLNQLFSSKPLTVCLGGLVLFLEPLLHLLQINLSMQELLPSHYISFGPVLHGVKDYFFYEGNFTVKKGLLVLSISTIIFFLVTYFMLLTRDQTVQRRRFVWGLQR